MPYPFRIALTLGLIFYLGAFAQAQPRADYPFSKVEVHTLLANLKTTNLSKHLLFEVGEELGLLDMTGLGDGATTFSFLTFSVQGKLKEEKQIHVDKKTAKLLSRYSPQGAAYAKGHLYVLTGKFLLIWSDKAVENGKTAELIELSISTNAMLYHDEVIYPYRNSIFYSNDDRGKVLSLSRYDQSKKQVDMLYSDVPYDRYLFFFNSPKPFALHQSGIFFMSPGVPEIVRMNQKGEVKYRFKTFDDWITVSDEEARALNQLAQKSASKVFAKLADRLVGELSMNIRLDFLDENHLALTYLPGKTENAEHLSHFDIFQLNEGELTFLKGYKGMYSSMSAENPNFGFPNRHGYNFFVKDSKRYQIGIIPAETIGLEGDARAAAWQKSMDFNKFELCLFIGHFDL